MTTLKRDYTILLLLVTYGLRAREVAALTLEDIDWKRDRLHVRGRKADHSAIYPLAPIVGEAVLDYLQHGRPKIPERALFCRAFAPHTALSRVAVDARMPVAFGVITCNTIEQAVERSSKGAGNKGWEAALAAIEMANLWRALRTPER